MPNTGPSDGSRKHTAAFLPIRLSPSPGPLFLVLCPAPPGVGLIAVTRISLPSGLPCCFAIQSSEIFPLVRPYGTSASSGIARRFAISEIGSSFPCWAISMSVNIALPPADNRNSCSWRPRARETSSAAVPPASNHRSYDRVSSAVHGHDRARHIARVGRCKKQRDLRDLLRRPETAEWNLCLHPLQQLRLAEAGHLRFDGELFLHAVGERRPRVDPVDANALRPERRGESRRRQHQCRI